MNIELVKATREQKPMVANLLELYAYDLSAVGHFDLGVNGFYGYQDLPLYWTDRQRIPYIAYVDTKIAGLVLVRQLETTLEGAAVYDVAEFFIVKKYQNRGIGCTIAHRLWREHIGLWQVRVWEGNTSAVAFWRSVIQRFVTKLPDTARYQEGGTAEDDWWVRYRFSSQ